jgi:hypothetical protein
VNYVLGYTLDYPDGTSKFVPITEGTFLQMQRLKMTLAPPDYHGHRPVTGCKWEVREESKVWIPRKESMVEVDLLMSIVNQKGA